MTALQKVEEESSRRARICKILGEARANVANHVSRDERVAAVLATARDNIVRLDPKRFPSILAPVHAEQLHREARAARQRRIARVLAEARDTLRRVAHIKPPSLNSEIVQRTTENARVASTSPSAAPRLKAKALPIRADDIDDLRHRLAALHKVAPRAVATEYEREFDILHRELAVMRREYDLGRPTS